MAGAYVKGPGDYRKAVQELVTQIGGNPVGKVILAAISGTKNDLMILPLSEWNGKGEKHCRAITRPKDHLTSAPKGTGGKTSDRRNKLYLGKDDDPDTDDDERYDAANPSQVATGGGSNTLLYFTPGEWGKSGCDSGCVASAPDEVFLHELVHAQRDMQGVANPVPTLDANYKNEEEFLAIVVANVYISAKGGTQFRATYRTCQALWSPLNTSKGFVDDRNNSWLLTQHAFSEWRPVFGALASLKAPKFNPFREFVNRL